MKPSYALIALWICIVVLVFSMPVLAQQGKQLQSVDLQPRFIEVEDLSAEFSTASSTVTVSGRVKNVSQQIIQGYIIVYLLSAEGQEVFSFQEDVNGGEPFANGASVDFEGSAVVADMSKVSSISVDFTKK